MAPPRDSGEHGTHTAAIIAGRAIEGKFLGIAPGAKLASALVIEGGEDLLRVLGGLNWALTRGCRVLSISLGVKGYVPDFLQIIQTLRTRGVLPVIAVGNDGPGISRSPGNYAEVLSVGACNLRKQVAEFSGSQQFFFGAGHSVPRLVAPGVNILSAVPYGKFKRMSGTSMAAPHIAGLAALLFETAPTASIVEVEEAILGSCSLRPRDDPARLGHGVPDAIQAYRNLTGQELGAITTAVSSDA